MTPPTNEASTPEEDGFAAFASLVEKSAQAAAASGVVEDYRNDCPLARDLPSPGVREWRETYAPDSGSGVIGAARGTYASILFPIYSREDEPDYRGYLRDLSYGITPAEYTVVENTPSNLVLEGSWPEGRKRLSLGLADGLIVETTLEQVGVSEFLGPVDCTVTVRFAYASPTDALKDVQTVRTAVDTAVLPDGTPTPEQKERIREYTAGVLEGRARACDLLSKVWPDRYGLKPSAQNGLPYDDCSDLDSDLEQRYARTAPVMGNPADIREYGRWRGWDYLVDPRDISCPDAAGGGTGEGGTCPIVRHVESPFVSFVDLVDVVGSLNPTP